MKSYIKIYGPPYLKAIKVLEKIAIDMSEVCIWDTLIEMENKPGIDWDTYFANFHGFPGDGVPEMHCEKIISKSGEKIGEYDFYFEWSKKPTTEKFDNLIEKIDNALAPLGCKYTITTK